MSEDKKKLGDAIFSDIESNVYLNELYNKILFNYAIRLFQFETITAPKEFELKAALRFAEIFSKSNHTMRSDVIRCGSGIVILLNQFIWRNSLVKLCGLCFSSTGPPGLNKLTLITPNSQH